MKFHLSPMIKNIMFKVRCQALMGEVFRRSRGFYDDCQSKLDVEGDSIRIRNKKIPSGSSDTSGNVGDIAWDDEFIYVKTSGGWKKARLCSLE